MRDRLALTWVLGVTVLLLLGIPALAGNAHFFGERGEEFDLADLRDGESRTFGDGEDQLTAVRDGDVVTLSRPGNGERRDLALECRVGTDTCKVITIEGDDGDQIMVVVEKRRECVNGEGDCDFDLDHIVMMEGAGDGHHVVIERRVTCGVSEGVSEGECENIEIHALPGDGHGAFFITEDGDVSELAIAGAHANVWISDDGTVTDLKARPGAHVVLHADGALLRCPESDTTMRVNRDEVEDVFLCPKHSVPLEEQERGSFVRKIRIKEQPHEH